MDVKRRKRLINKAIDQVERLLELTQKATGRPSLPILKDSEKLKRRLRSKFKVFDYPTDDFERVIDDIVEFHEGCRKFLQIVDEALDTPTDPGEIGDVLGNAVVRLDGWKTRLAKMPRSLARFRYFLSDQAAVQEKARKKSSIRRRRQSFST